MHGHQNIKIQVACFFLTGMRMRFAFHIFSQRDFFSNCFNPFKHIVMYHQTYCSQSLNFTRRLYFAFAWAVYVCFKILAAGFTSLKALPILIASIFLTQH